MWAYDELTGQIELHPVTAIWAEQHEIVVYLTIAGEVIETTPEHPFKIITGEYIPAGSLEVGVEIISHERVGTVETIEFVSRRQVMYNLTVDQAHTYFVGHGQWLVHNACKVGFQPKEGLARDILTKGYHVNSNIGELSLVPFNGSVQVQRAGSKTGQITPDVLNGVNKLLSENRGKAINQLEGIISSFGHDRNYTGRIQQARELIEILSQDTFTVIR